MTPATRLVGGALAVLLTAGCGAQAAGGSGAAADPAREWRVAEDPDATTAEMIDVGGPADVAVSADGERRLVTWRVEPEDDEGSSWGAWRLYDAEGERVADGHFDQVVEQTAVILATAVGDGFVLVDYASGRLRHLDADGTLTRVGASPARGPVQPGDVLLDAYADVVYRPSDRSTHRLPRLPTADPQGAAVDPEGGVHVLLPRRPGGDALVAASPGGTGPWTRTRLALPGDAYPGGLVTAVDGSLLLVGVAPDQDFGHPVVVHRLAPGATSWSTTRVPADERLGEAAADVLDGRVLLDDDRRAVLLGAGTDAPDEVDLPEPDAGVEVAGDRLWVLGLRSNTLWSSDDLGVTWREVDR